MHRAELNRFTCKLQLIQHGLLEEANELDVLHPKTRTSKAISTDGAASDTDMESEESEESVSEEHLQQQRNEFVKLAIKKAGSSKCKTEVAAEKVEAISGERRAVIKEFLAAAPASKTCGNCNG